MFNKFDRWEPCEPDEIYPGKGEEQKATRQSKATIIIIIIIGDALVDWLKKAWRG